MVRVTDDLAFSPDTLSLYHASDPLLGQLPVLIFHGPSTTANYTLNSSRVQIHILSSAGFQSFPRITISPSSPFYGVVDHLPREIQVDEVFRGLAFGLFKYFSELPDGVKTYLRNLYPTRGKRPGSAPRLFGEQHAAGLIASMVKGDNAAEVIASLQDALQPQHINNVDVDLVLPPGAIVPLPPADWEEVPDNEDDILDPSLRQYGGYTPLIRLFGEPVFLPTHRLRRAPSKPTSLNRGRSFNKDQRYELRMKLAELVDTEERYVMKLGELVNTIAKDFRESAKARPEGSLSPSEAELEKLFPPSADQILQLNSAFVDQLRTIMDETEDEALRYMEQTASTLGSMKSSGSARVKDPSGALSMAKLFLEWFPKFTQSYQDYIKASQHFPTLLNSFLDKQSSFRQRVNQTGEQTVRSILIEPVQRLPRYSLLIDQIVGSLPITHPALQPMLKARDIITNICSMDDPLPDRPHVANRLRNMVESWPRDLEPQGRLIAAADFIELAPPFQGGTDELDSGGVFLLFADCLIILRKIGLTMTGRDLLREIDKPSVAELLISMTNAVGGPASYEFALTGWHSLADVRFTESEDGALVWMTSTRDMKYSHAGEYKISKAPTSRCFLLQEALEGKATKWGEDVVKARVEARFSETERENPCWTLRSVRMQDSNLGLHVAVFQEGAHELVEGRREPAAIRIVVDHEKGTKGAPLGHYGVEIVINLSSNNLKRVSMLTAGLNGKQFHDDVDLEDLLPTMSRRIIQLLSIQFNVSNANLTASMVSYYTKTLRRLNISTKVEKGRSFLAASPVKLLSSLWNSGTSSLPDVVVSSTKPQQQALLHRANSIHSMFGSIKGKDSRPNTADGRPENPLLRLEQTFTGFTAALQSRKGTIIGRTLLNRSLVDELSVNKIYNRFIETPFDYAVSCDINTEVIFAAFEKFLHIAWADQIGPVMTMQAMDSLLDRANKRVPGNFADFVNYLFRDMAPQNRRAFITVIKLLADLLDGCGNDSDRGALTVAFAELLVTDGDAHNYINLLDRLVEDCDRIFEDQSAPQSFHPGSFTSESIESGYRQGKTHTGSVTSNASSLRRKFGLNALLRPSSQDERPSVWRSLSKHRNPTTGDTSSLSRSIHGTLYRAPSVDNNSLPKRLHRRATSRERPSIAGAFDETPQRPTSSHRLDFPLDTIGEPSSTERVVSSTKSPKKKRRSSLSDLKSLMAAAKLDDEPPQPLQTTKQTSGKINTKPATPQSTSPSKIPISPSAAGTIGASRQKEKENLADSSEKVDSHASEHSGVISSKLPDSLSKIYRHPKALSISSIPTLRSTKSASDAITSPGSPTRSNAQRLRLHSPQKLRERLQSEKQVAQEVDSSLKSELSKIGDEMARVYDSRSASSRTDVSGIATSLKELEDRIEVMMRELHEQQATTQKELDTTMKITEAKVRAIDQLHKEVVAENELLYEKFNGELGKIIKAMRGKGRDDKEELVVKLKEQGDETAKLKKENARLKREMVSLKAMLRGAD
ncbi:Rho guanyl nucleotide exchange factor [Metarhizium album ARSEF 1941]|uniref:Rho guanyl nucleotide exchange factor n=1 Tax=Metarhizium album (strain ARSEF 1941) TaxID=1081103 RepID=A0A0B2WLA0_METAS|nr:Rho guanyl nucleotide exchange factor [Metarhizium album ARSEF 1941]KHN93780.1 Rho guanyl nucleotide exchange factor [Metarhizium album ARSEF 1941]